MAPDRIGQGKARLIDATRQLARDLGLDIALLKLAWGDAADPTPQALTLALTYGERAADPLSVSTREVEACAFSSAVPARLRERLTASLRPLAAR